MKKTETDEHSYLWDGSGEPDPEVVRLEKLLGQLRHRGNPPSVPVRRPRAFTRTTWIIGGLSAAAALLLAAGIGWYVLGRFGNGWTVETLSGRPVVDGVRASGDGGPAGRLRVGDWLETDDVSRARIARGEVGRVEVDPNTRLQLVEAGGEHRMSLSKGTIHARIWSPPKIFFVNTPSATAIDLGCEYTLQVDVNGAGLIRVTLGWVSFEGYGRESYIPNGAIGTTRPGAGPGTPYYEDAPPGYGEALTILDYEKADDPRRTGALDVVLTSARPHDALTLWHLLSRGTPAEKARVYDRLAILVPPPEGVTRSAVLAGDKQALEQWWDALGLDTGLWKLWRKAQ